MNVWHGQVPEGIPFKQSALWKNIRFNGKSLQHDAFLRITVDENFPATD